MKDFIITSLQSWDIGIGSTIKNTAIEISKKHRVLYVNPPMNYLDWRKVSQKEKTGKLIQVIPNLWILYLSFPIIPIGKISNNYLFDMLNYINNRKISKGIFKATNELRFRNYIHLIDTDIYRSQYLKELLHPTLSIYYCRDFVIGVPYWKKHGARLESRLAAKADIVLTNSSYFAKRLKPYNNNTYSIETGVNLSLYDSNQLWKIPEDMVCIPNPIIGYTGSLTSLRLDIELLYQLALRMAAMNFVYVGPFDETFEKHPLHQLPNVYYLGRKEVYELPAYIQHFDVCINPQLVNEITYGNYPLKIDEYLAMGKPTIATSTHTMLDIFKEHTFLPTNIEEYVKDISAALQEVGDKTLKEARIAFAHTHSWENSVNKIYKAVKETELQNGYSEDKE